MHIQRALMRGVVAVVVLTAMLMTSPLAFAGTHGCYGSSCKGLNPVGRCDSDAVTVKAIHVKDGLLELRWSPSCVANWGRYTPYSRTVDAYAVSGIVIHASMIAWNPAGQFYPTAHHAVALGGSSWSQMVDGRWTACTAVEVVHSHEDWTQSQGLSPTICR